jgi:hypothetical protein
MKHLKADRMSGSGWGGPDVDGMYVSASGWKTERQDIQKLTEHPEWDGMSITIWDFQEYSEIHLLWRQNRELNGLSSQANCAPNCGQK